MTSLDEASVSIDLDLERARRRVQDLTGDLERSRTLGTAIGMVVERLRIDVDSAERVLQALARRDDRDVLLLARELVATGRLGD